MYIIAKNPQHTRYTTIPVASCVYKQDPDAACLLFTACRLCYHVPRTAQPYLHPQHSWASLLLKVTSVKR